MTASLSALLTGLDPQRLMSAIVLIVMVLFVAGGTPGAGRWRGPLRLAAIIGFGVAVVLAVAEVGWWLAGGRP